MDMKDGGMDPARTGSGRRRWTAGQRQRLLTRFLQSQLTQIDFATQPGLGLSTLSRWLRLERDPISPKVDFQEVWVPRHALRWSVEVVKPPRLDCAAAKPLGGAAVALSVAGVARLASWTLKTFPLALCHSSPPASLSIRLETMARGELMPKAPAPLEGGP